VIEGCKIVQFLFGEEPETNEVSGEGWVDVAGVDLDEGGER
jgi:hypothetical protein